MRYPSRFIFDIDKGLLQYDKPIDDSLAAEACMYIKVSQSSMISDEKPPVYSPGDRVKHAVFGEGTVLEADMSGLSHIVQFDNMNTPRAISFRAKLERC